MSSWKDTAMSEQELDKLAKANPLLDFSFEDDYREEVRLMREAQAEISFPAGEKQGIEKGIREVVEWMKKHRNEPIEAKLKDWGIE